MRRNWSLVEFSSIFKDPKYSIISGPFGSNLKASEYQDSGVPLVRLQNVDRFNFLNKNIKYVTSKKAVELASHAYKVGDILVTKLGDPLGKACIAPIEAGEGIVLADIIRVRVDEHLIDKKFVLYQINSDFIGKQLASKTTGATRPRVTLQDFRKVDFILPPLSEQKQIVAILDRVFEAIDKAMANIEKNIQNTEEFFQSKLNEVFGQKHEDWIDVKLSEVAIIKPPKKLSKEKLNGNDLVSFVAMENLGINQNYVTGLNTKTLDEVYSGYVYFENDDVILAKITPCFENGKLGIAKDLVNGVGFGSSEFIVYRLDMSRILPEFLYHFLNRDTFRNKGKNLMSGAVGHKRIQPDFYQNEVIQLPAIEEQKKHIEQLNSIHSQIDRYVEKLNSKLVTLKALKKSILQMAFDGRLISNFKAKFDISAAVESDV